MSDPFSIFIGFDSREPVVSYVAAHSIARRTNAPLCIRYLNHWELREAGHFNRPWLTHNHAGGITDILDGKTFSTEFSHTRFLVPHLTGFKGWALFMDADIVFFTDIRKLMAFCDPRYAIVCTQHVYKPFTDGVKMDGRLQQFYRRKNWSSFVLWNCGHPSNARLTAERVNFMQGSDLHAFSWLRDEEIGALPFTYNYISGTSPALPHNVRPDVMHYTDGGPWFDKCQDVPYAQAWIDEYEHWQRHGEGNKYSDVPTTRFEL